MRIDKLGLSPKIFSYEAAGFRHDKIYAPKADNIPTNING
jgi:hypothetical protein